MMPNALSHVTLLCALTAGPLMAAPDSLCDRAARAAAVEFGIPENILRAITRVETGRGRDLRPWPWAINQAGAGGWFATQAEAVLATEAALATGAENVDIGCFQLNYRWHGAAFPSVAAMFDPGANARYAASFLADLYAEQGDWAPAVAAYHSRTPEHADRYLARVEEVFASLDDAPAAIVADDPDDPPRENRFPLLQAGGQGAKGSLVPLILASTPLFGAP